MIILKITEDPLTLKQEWVINRLISPTLYPVLIALIQRNPFDLSSENDRLSNAS